MSFSVKRAIFGGVEVVKGFAEGLALAEDCDPREAGLEAVEHEGFPEGAAIALGAAPLVVMIGLHKWVVGGPGAAGLCDLWVGRDLNTTGVAADQVNLWSFQRAVAVAIQIRAAVVRASAAP